MNDKNLDPPLASAFSQNFKSKESCSSDKPSESPPILQVKDLSELDFGSDERMKDFAVYLAN